MSVHGHGHGHDDHHEELRKISIMLEVDQIDALRELAKEYEEKLGQRWSISAMVRTAVGGFLSNMGKIS